MIRPIADDCRLPDLVMPPGGEVEGALWRHLPTLLLQRSRCDSLRSLAFSFPTDGRKRWLVPVCCSLSEAQNWRLESMRH